MKNSDGEEVTDNEFYMVTYEDSNGEIKTISIHIRFGETVFWHMSRVYHIGADNIHCIYKRTYVK